MQIGLRIPVILIALFGVVFALVTMRRLGIATGVLVALGSLFIAVDQLLNILWVLDVTSTASEGNYDVDTLTSTNNLCTVADAALITIGAAFVVASVVVRRIAGGPNVPAQPAQLPDSSGRCRPASGLPAWRVRRASRYHRDSALSPGISRRRRTRDRAEAANPETRG